MITAFFSRIAAAALLCATLAACDKRPDLTGIWVMQPDGRASIALNGPGDFEQTAPFTAEARQRLDQYHALVDPTGDTPSGRCVTHGMPLAVFLGGGYPVEFIHRDEQLTVIYETHNEVRRIFLDGRHIASEDILPSRGGTSWGQWDSDTLVVETTGLSDGIDQPTAHSGEHARIVERYTPFIRDGLRRLAVEVTIHDPVFYTEPPVLTREYTELQDGRMLDYSCTEPEWHDHLEMLKERQGR